MKKLIVVSFVFCTSLTITLPVLSQQMFKCMDGDKVRFQQMPCSPTNVGERMPVKKLPGTGEGLRESEMMMIDYINQEKAQQAAAAARREAQEEREAYERATQQYRDASGSGQRSMTREEQSAWENAQKDMNSRFSTKQDKINARETMRMIESRSNSNVPAAPVEIHNHYVAPSRPLNCISTGVGTATCN